MSDPGALDPDRRAGLHAAKLRALVRDHFGGVDTEATGSAGGAALRDENRGWYLAEVQSEQALGWALAWASQQGVDSLDVLATEAAGDLARRAGCFGSEIHVWQVDGSDLAPAEPSLHPEPPAAPDGIDDLVAMLDDAGLDVVEEHGEVWGELLGLELARITQGDGGAPALEVGAGRNDREAFGMMHGDVPTPEALAAVVDSVRAHRHADARRHPLNKLAAERWLRRVLVEAPENVGASELEIVQPVHPRPNIKDQSPAAAVGLDVDGAPLVVVSTVGVDLDAVPTAADIALRHTGSDGVAPAVVLALPTRDALPVTRALVDDLIGPARVQTVDDEWRSYA